MIPTWVPVALILLPLLAALLGGLLRQRAGVAHAAAGLLLGLSAVLAAWQAVAVVGSEAALVGASCTWLDLGTWQLAIGVMVDPLGALMALVVAVLGTLVLAFNRWYMHDEPLAGRFPWQFSGFVAAMQGLVLADNLFLTFCCWELVGLGSYLLIGFYGHKATAAEDPEYQARKGQGARGVVETELSPGHAQWRAFVQNRIGDALFLVGIGALLAATVAHGQGGPALGFAQLPELAVAIQRGAGTVLGLSGDTLLLVAALGIFGGAVGKSAQLPLCGWLPDAMQGPTTASSILHAATMVAAGVFLVARCAPWFPADALLAVGWVGGLSCLYAATVACVQWDLKAVLAYSTISQLGLMFVGLSAGPLLGGVCAGTSHLLTHACFKCLLFLAAGAVIHAASGQQDLWRFGGLRRQMPVVAWTSLAAVLAITGAPFFSGFYSKDAVLAAALAAAHQHGGAHWLPLVAAALGSLLTAAYMVRWWLLVFAGTPRAPELGEHAHDPHGAARWVLLGLAPLTLAAPWALGGWLDRALGAPADDERLHQAHTQATLLALAALGLGAGFALWLFRGAPGPTAMRERAAQWAQRFAALHRAAGELWGLERAWQRWFRHGLCERAATAAAEFDLGAPQRLAQLEAGQRTPVDHESLDGFWDGLGRALGRCGRGLALLHRGHLGVYLATAVAAVGIGYLAGWWR